MTTMSCLNLNYACSSLVIGSFYEADTLNDLCAHLQMLMDRKDIPSYGGLYPATAFSFVTASTNESNHNTKKNLSDLGFLATDESFNKKNETIVQLHFITVYELLKKLKELNYWPPPEEVKPDGSSSLRPLMWTGGINR